jgi:hypothetical protein
METAHANNKKARPQGSGHQPSPGRAATVRGIERPGRSPAGSAPGARPDWRRQNAARGAVPPQTTSGDKAHRARHLDSALPATPSGDFGIRVHRHSAWWAPTISASTRSGGLCPPTGPDIRLHRHQSRGGYGCADAQPPTPHAPGRSSPAGVAGPRAELLGWGPSRRPRGFGTEHIGPQLVASNGAASCLFDSPASGRRDWPLLLNPLIHGGFRHTEHCRQSHLATYFLRCALDCCHEASISALNSQSSAAPCCTG